MNIQKLARILYRAIMISFIILIQNEKAIWAIPLGLLIGVLSELKKS